MWVDVRAVIRREYLQRVRSKWFVLGTLLGPVVLVAFTVGPLILGNRGGAEERTVAVADGTGVLLPSMRESLSQGGFTMEEVAWPESAAPEENQSEQSRLERIQLEELQLEEIYAEQYQRLSDGDIGAFLILNDATLETGNAVLYAAERPGTLRLLMIRGAVTRAALGRQLDARGVDARAVLEGGELEIHMLGGSGSSFESPRFMVAYGGALLLYMVILLYAVAVMRATLEEKTNRIVEVIVSSMRPWHLMLGKILGVGAVGLTQLAVWLGAGALLASTGLPAVLAMRPEMAGLEQIRALLPGLGLLALFVGYFLFGYFMYAGLYAAVGAMCSNDQEAQQAQAPVVMFMIVPILLVTSVIEDPGSALAVSSSLFPLFSPVLMWARLAGGVVPGWQVALSFVLMAGTVVAVAWLAGRIYKVGILMTGKRPTAGELWRWLREA